MPRFDDDAELLNPILKVPEKLFIEAEPKLTDRDRIDQSLVARRLFSILQEMDRLSATSAQDDLALALGSLTDQAIQNLRTKEEV